MYCLQPGFFLLLDCDFILFLSLCCLLLLLFLFLEQFWIHGKIERKVQRLLMFLLFPSFRASPSADVLRRSGTSVTVDKPNLTRHNHPKPLLYVRGHSWRCTLPGFGQRCNETCSSLWSIFTVLKILLALALHPSSPTDLPLLSFFLCLIPQLKFGVFVLPHVIIVMIV